MVVDILITNIKSLFQVRERTPGFIAGSAMQELPFLKDAYVMVNNGLITDYGLMKSMPDVTASRIVDASGKFVLPSFIDSHTHVIFASGREEEFVMKIKGATYEEIAAKGGGILNSAKKLQQLTEDELFERTMPRIKEIIESGTGALEIKSGYGLTVKDELKMLRVARRIGRETGLTVKTTLLGAHAVPTGVNKADYIRLVIEEMIPAAVAEKLADYIDVFCEEGFFSQDETELIANAGRSYGLRPRIHANQLHRSGGVQAGVNTDAISVDHLENIGDEEISVLKNTRTMPTALPGAAFFLNLPFTPARKIIDAGLPLAIASDYNPGSSPSGNMPLVVSLGCIRMKMLPEEAFNAATINTAYAIDELHRLGSITKGKVANLIITKTAPSLAHLPYSFGARWIEKVILNGRII